MVYMTINVLLTENLSLKNYHVKKHKMLWTVWGYIWHIIVLQRMGQTLKIISNDSSKYDADWSAHTIWVLFRKIKNNKENISSYALYWKYTH